MNPPLPNRRPHIGGSAGPFRFTVSFHPVTGAPVEVFINERAKIGTELEAHLYDLGVKISKVMQGE